ncbi:CHRD domain protein [Posidoniimonas polymericola]|uniref:CHRD domain protein n=1 Tax=Posidoniimonas polymericola TaxID=2528002 RepID=A0A5C5YU53_9BACT|nr:CHRD domain-containing protein [Posidoniimonas polymericola]TWT78552.1 CHRD domain protein [Posidoniimonas polymericola]
MKKFLTLTLLLTAAPALAHTSLYEMSFSGPSSSGTGTGLVTVDPHAWTMRVEADFSGLTGNVTAAHIHCCTLEPFAGNAGVASPTPTFPGFPSGVTAGSYDMIFDMTDAGSYNAAFITANGGTTSSAFAALMSGFDGGNAYLNIHTTAIGSGEIRAYLTSVPEPTAAGVGLLALSLLGVRRGRRD